jgi:hypothetical protein
MPGRLPNFLVIGAMKSGTSSLAAYLESNPSVWLYPEKELHFFDTHWDNGVDWYRSRFEGANGHAVVGEATPAYLFHPDGARRMANVVPDAQLIAILRNPVDRAYSHYWHHRSNGKETRSFGEAVSLEGRRKTMGDPREFWYVARGLYLEQFDRLVQYFDRDQLHVMLLDDLENDPSTTLKYVWSFLDVPEITPTNLGEQYNTASALRFRRLWNAMYTKRLWRFVPKAAYPGVVRVFRKSLAYPAMDPDVRNRLLDFYLPYNEALGDWLGRDLVGLWHDQ